MLDIATSEEMRELLTSPVKQSQSATNGNLKQLDSGILFVSSLTCICNCELG